MRRASCSERLDLVSRSRVCLSGGDSSKDAETLLRAAELSRRELECQSTKPFSRHMHNAPTDKACPSICYCQFNSPPLGRRCLSAVVFFRPLPESSESFGWRRGKRVPLSVSAPQTGAVSVRPRGFVLCDCVLDSLFRETPVAVYSLHRNGCPGTTARRTPQNSSRESQGFAGRSAFSRRSSL